MFMLKGSSAERVLYLTFDDGPTPEVTDKLITLLKQYDAKATFFMIGKKLQQNESLGLDVIENGHAVGNHSYDHIGFGRLSLKKQIKQAVDADLCIRKVNAGAERLFRAPQGHWRASLVFNLFLKGFKSVHWSYDSLDYSNSSAGTIIENFHEAPVSNGEILLFHDDSTKCIDVLEKMLPSWKEQGFKFEVIQ